MEQKTQMHRFRIGIQQFITTTPETPTHYAGGYMRWINELTRPMRFDQAKDRAREIFKEEGGASMMKISDLEGRRLWQWTPNIGEQIFDPKL